VEDRIIRIIEVHWRRIFWLLLAGAVVYFLAYKWGAIRWLALGDTDDNMRFAQVRALLNGQDWYDLRQHKLDPPMGASIHWTRIVDLPLAALLLIFQPLAGSYFAQQVACAVAPMLAFAVTLWALILTSRRMIAPTAYPLAFAMLMCAQTSLGMWMPLRIDHHGWQLAMLMLAVAGLTDSNQRRSGITVAIASAISIGIGLELLPSMAVAGAAIVVRWIWDREETERLRTYAVALGGSIAFIYAAFASYDNRQLICDALTPVYLAPILAASALLLILSAIRTDHRWLRLALAAIVAFILAAGFAHCFPQCLGRPEHISPELDKLWFHNVREVKPLYSKDLADVLSIVALPVVGIIGSFWGAWRTRGTRFAAVWIEIGVLTLFSTSMLAWQARYGPQAQMLGVVGAALLAWSLLWYTLDHRFALVRLFGSVIAFLACSGLLVEYGAQYLPKETVPKSRKAVENANRRCPTLPALKTLSAFPPATMLTMVDFGPRLIAMTAHRAIAGPYHRNGAAILDIHHAFRSTDPEVAHDVMKRHNATMLLLCPGMSETTLYASEAPKGFYIQLVKGQVPAWLQPVELPAKSPYKLWRLVG
jgi:hypothetical protein